MIAYAMAASSVAHGPGARRWKLSREAAMAVTASILVHVGVGAHLALQTFTSPQPIVEPPGPIEGILYELPRPRLRTDAPRSPRTPVQIRPNHLPPDTEVPPLEARPTPDSRPAEHPPEALPFDPPTAGGDGAALDPPPPPPPPPEPRVIRNPSWLQQPTAAQMARLYPRRAAEMGLGGRAVLACEVAASGAVRNCSLAEESPKGRGFGAAALQAASLFKLNPRTENGATVEGARVRIPLVFNSGD